jgi:hypothetical protein
MWKILWSFGAYFPVLLRYTKKNLATLIETQTVLPIWGANPGSSRFSFIFSPLYRQSGSPFD